MKHLNVIAKLIASLVIVTCSSSSIMAQTNLILNGTFDSGTAYSIPNWTLSGGAFLNGKTGNPKPDIWLGLGGTISQTISGLTIGETYTISGDYYTSSSDYTTLMLKLSVDGDTLTEYSGTAKTWKSFTYDYIATTTSITLSFTQIAGDACVIDNITMYATAVPEPSTTALIVLGLGTVGFACRRKVKK